MSGGDELTLIPMSRTAVADYNNNNLLVEQVWQDGWKRMRHSVDNDADNIIIIINVVLEVAVHFDVGLLAVETSVNVFPGLNGWTSGSRAAVNHSSCGWHRARVPAQRGRSSG